MLETPEIQGRKRSRRRSGFSRLPTLSASAPLTHSGVNSGEDTQTHPEGRKSLLGWNNSCDQRTYSHRVSSVAPLLSELSSLPHPPVLTGWVEEGA